MVVVFIVVNQYDDDNVMFGTFSCDLLCFMSSFLIKYRVDYVKIDCIKL